jgi:hypothetical protein
MEYLNEQERETHFREEHRNLVTIFGDIYTFDICIPCSELDDIVSTQKDIMIQNTYNCYCYSEVQRPPDYFHLRSDKPHTVKTIIKELIKKEFDPDCNHRFLEGISKKTGKSDMTFELHMGS